MRSIVFLLLCVAACSSSTTNSNDGGMTVTDLAVAGTGGNGAADLAKSAATVTVDVPADFKGTPRQLLVAAFDSFPVTGPPAGILYQGTPAIAAGATLHLPADTTGLSGSKQLLAVLYVEGGGQFSPTPGIDYASAPTAVSFPSSATDLGTLTLAVVPAVDGGP